MIHLTRLITCLLLLTAYAASSPAMAKLTSGENANLSQKARLGFFRENEGLHWQIVTVSHCMHWRKTKVKVGRTSGQLLYGDDLIGQTQNSINHYYLYDGLGSTRALSDQMGTITDTYDYEAFGTLLNQTGTTDNDYLFTGEQFDSALDNYYLRARYYDPGSARFTQMDEWMGVNSDPSTLHKYLYTANDPVNMVDPSGHFFSLSGASATTNIMGALAATATASYGIGQSLSATDWSNNGGEFNDLQTGWLILLAMVSVHSSLHDLIVSDTQENGDDGECGRLFGPYYRYEMSTELAVQASRGWMYGRTPRNGGAWPTVQAYTSPKPSNNEVVFCTPVKPSSEGGGFAQWYRGTVGVIDHDGDTVKIPIKVLRN